MRKTAGFTLIEILVVTAIIATLAGLVVIMVPLAQHKAAVIGCTNQLRNLSGLLENVSPRGFPQHSGANLVLSLVDRGELAGKDALQQLFCPGDVKESLEAAGGPDAFQQLDLKRNGQYDALTSYAAPDQSKPEYRLKRGGRMTAILVDDSDDHHDGKGVLLALTGGAVKWRDKYDDYELSVDAELIIGPGSQAEELRCFRVD